MAENSKIEWTDHTFNPWIGCQEVSPACDNCYARVQNDFRKWVAGWGPHGQRKRTKTWGDPVRWNRLAAKDGVRRKVFCASLADVFDNKADPEWRADLFELIRTTPHLDWLLLTKRPQNIIEMVRRSGAIAGNGERYLPTNVWLGATAETQAHADNRSKHLLQTRECLGSDILFLSVEPMLGPVVPDPNISWVICGGESAKGVHRPMDLKWARDLRDQCAKSDTAFFMKQIDKKQTIPADLLIREFPTPHLHTGVK